MNSRGSYPGKLHQNQRDTEFYRVGYGFVACSNGVSFILLFSIDLQRIWRILGNPGRPLKQTRRIQPQP
ncbi:protein of unknown function (plasmid) [Cupriavidus taiwanensis]|nr:protein of unknown function [Cupriavidus taiwanensis]